MGLPPPSPSSPFQSLTLITAGDGVSVFGGHALSFPLRFGLQNGALHLAKGVQRLPGRNILLQAGTATETVAHSAIEPGCRSEKNEDFAHVLSPLKLAEQLKVLGIIALQQIAHCGPTGKP